MLMHKLGQSRESALVCGEDVEHGWSRNVLALQLKGKQTEMKLADVHGKGNIHGVVKQS